MAGNDNDSHRDKDRRPEDNPFVAFRRSVDSQIGSLLKSVSGLPAIMSSADNIHNARKKCLLQKSQDDKCKELIESGSRLERDAQQLLRDLPELLLGGDAHAVSRKADDLMQRVDKQDRLSEEILADKEEVQLIEKVASEKGQRWGWSWDWGFPRPFDAEDSSDADNGCHERMPCRRRRWRERRERSNDQLARAILEAHGISETRDNSKAGGVPCKFRPASFPFGMDPYSPLALEENEELQRVGVHWRDAYEDLVRAEYGAPLIPEDQRGRSARLPYHVWENRIWVPFMRPPVENDQWKLMERELGQHLNSRAENKERDSDHTKAEPGMAWEGEETSEEPAYEYSHDHEDQHDEPPTPKTNQGEWAKEIPATELEAYERLLAPTHERARQPQDKPSVLSTLTTTERTVASDGSVTTKVVLKKRFADGREESSETVHTQRGQDADAVPQDPWKSMQEAQFPSANGKSYNQDDRKKGWFWS